jgi:5'-methylthioinosine phosphorylase
MLAVIGGNSLEHLENLEILEHRILRTSYGEPSSPCVFGRIAGHDVVFLARHGHGGHIAPQNVNYRANIDALHQLGVTRILAMVSATALDDTILPVGSIILPDQLIDYTFGREGTFFTDQEGRNVPFDQPFDRDLLDSIVEAAHQHETKLVTPATLAVLQGPRMPTRAEAYRLERDGAIAYAFTPMPEAILAREKNMAYSNLALVVTPLGCHGHVCTNPQLLKTGTRAIHRVLETLVGS